MTDLPVWVQLCVASVPLLGALIAGGFGLANTVNRRVERLKSLNDLYATFPKHALPANALEQIMLNEVKAIDFATNPEYKWDRRVHVAAFFCVVVGTTLVILGLIYGNSAIQTAGSALAGTGGILIGIGVAWLNLHVAPLRAHSAYYQKTQELKGQPRKHD